MVKVLQGIVGNHGIDGNVGRLSVYDGTNNWRIH